LKFNPGAKTLEQEPEQLGLGLWTRAFILILNPFASFFSQDKFMKLKIINILSILAKII